MQVIKAPDPKLRIQTKPVKKITPGHLQTFKDMVKLTKTFVDPEGVGLAATQVGLGEQFFVAKVGGSERTRKAASSVIPAEESESKTNGSRVKPGMTNEFITVINPKIISTSKKTKKYFEGCLSIPNYWGEVERYLGIKVTYQDETGKIIHNNLTGVMAWIFQHEIDHLNGTLFVDRVLQQKGKFYKFTGKDKTGTDIFEEVTL
jgi:peptide deformylase